MFSAGENVFLRAPEPRDLDRLFAWENNTRLWHISDTVVPFTRFILAEFIKNASRDIYETRQMRFMIVTHEAEEPVGAVDLFHFDPRHSKVAVGILIHKSFRKRGYATEALKLICQYAFETLFMHQVYCDIPAGNKESIALFKGAGFEQSGIKKDWLRKEDGWEDILFLQKINQ